MNEPMIQFSTAPGERLVRRLALPVREATETAEVQTKLPAVASPKRVRAT